MSEKERGLGSHDALPIQLRVLRTQLEIIESDLCQALLALTKKKHPAKG